MVAIPRSSLAHAFLLTNHHHPPRRPDLLSTIAASASSSAISAAFPFPSISPSPKAVPSLSSPLLHRLHSLPLPRHLPTASASLVFMAVALDGPPLGYRPNVGVCLINSKNEVFVALRVDLPECWQMPQGGVDDNEEPRAAAIRELREETGVTSAEIIGEVTEWLTYDFPPDVKAKITVLWGKEWNGQAQKWFLFKFTGDESEIDLNGDGTERAEFSEWKWLPADKVVKGAVDFKRPVYEKVFKSFSPIFESGSGTQGASL